MSEETKMTTKTKRWKTSFVWSKTYTGRIEVRLNLPNIFIITSNPDSSDVKIGDDACCEWETNPWMRAQFSPSVRRDISSAVATIAEWPARVK